MAPLQRIKNFCRHNPLGLRLLTAILICSSAITLVATATQLWLDYRYELSAIDERLYQIETSSIKSLSNSLWEISPAQVQVQLDGLLQLPDVRYLEITSLYGDAFFAGSKPQSGQLLEHHYPLTHEDHRGKSFAVGNLTLIISLDEVYRRLGDKVLLILATQGIKTFLVSVFILTIFHQLITRHLSAMALYARRLKLDKLDQQLVLKRTPKNDDELSDVVSAINTMRRSMLHDIQKREQAEQSLEQANQQLEQLNSELEQRVAERTAQLQEKSLQLEERGLQLEERRRQLEERGNQLEERNEELQSTLIQLKATQRQLVESEKMAALGELVAGIAHEINTPIGIGFTAATFLSDQAKQLQQQMVLSAGNDLSTAASANPHSTRAFKTTHLNQSQPDQKLLSLALESSDLICKNLERAAQLVRAFKQVSVDQSSEQRRRFDLIKYLDEVVLSLQPRLKNCRPQIDIQGPEQLPLDSYPGSYYQIFSNLIINSVIHGFDNCPGGKISIKVTLQTHEGQTLSQLPETPEQYRSALIRIDYFDNGIGIPSGWHSKLFEPFVTSKRNQDCSGLGMHITYNLVSQILQGQIESLPVENASGAYFRLMLPIQLSSQERVRSNE